MTASPPAVASPVNEPRCILVFVPNWLGDAAMCTPALRALKRRFPQATLVAAARPGVARLLDGLPHVDGVLPVPKSGGLIATLKQARELRKMRPGLVAVFPHSFRAALLARLSGAPHRLGYARGGRAWLLTHCAPPHREDGAIAPIYMAREYLDLVALLGCEDDGQGLELTARPEYVEKVRERFCEHRPVVGFAPGAAFGPSKRWPPERFAAVADVLTKRANATCVLLTGPGEEDTREAVKAATKTGFVECDGGNPDIDSLKATISQLDLLVCNDSGPRHVAVAFKVPTICIMGPTSPAYSEGPYERGEVIRIDVECGPCQKPVCETDHRCMTGISTGRVADAALRVLRQRLT